MDDISIKTMFIVMSCKSILLLLFMWSYTSNIMDTISNRNDNYTQHTRLNYSIHFRRDALVVRLTQEMYIKQRFPKQVYMTIWTFLLFRIDLGHINWILLVTGMKTIWAKSHFISQDIFARRTVNGYNTCPTKTDAFHISMLCE